MKHTEIKIEFSAFGDCSLETISEHLNLDSDMSWNKGEKVGKVIRQESCWVLSTGYQESLDVNFQLNQIIEKLKSNKLILRTLKKEYYINYKFDIIIRIEDAQTPAMYLEAGTLRWISDIGADIDFDLYC